MLFFLPQIVQINWILVVWKKVCNEFHKLARINFYNADILYVPQLKKKFHADFADLFDFLFAK